MVIALAFREGTARAKSPKRGVQIQIPIPVLHLHLLPQLHYFRTLLIHLLPQLRVLQIKTMTNGLGCNLLTSHMYKLQPQPVPLHRMKVPLCRPPVLLSDPSVTHVLT